MEAGREERKEAMTLVPRDKVQRVVDFFDTQPTLLTIDGAWLDLVGHTRATVSLGGLFLSFDLEPVYREYAGQLGVADLTPEQKMQAVFNEAMRRAEDVSG